MSQPSPNTLNYMVGKGKVYFDEFDANGNQTGELDLGNDPSFNNNPTTETLDHYSSMEGVKLKDKSANISTDVNITFTLDEINIDNLNIALFGNGIHYVAQGDGNAVDEAMVARLGKWVKLGGADIVRRNLTAGTVVVTNAAGTITYVEGTDYAVDYEIGRIFTIIGGAIADAQNILVDYTWGAQSLPAVYPATNVDKEGLLRFVGNSTFGFDYEVVYWRVKLKVTGDIGLISEEWANIEFEAEVLADTANHPDNPYGIWYDSEGDITVES
jgi:hypothetical protein